MKNNPVRSGFIKFGVILVVKEKKIEFLHLISGYNPSLCALIFFDGVCPCVGLVFITASK